MLTEEEERVLKIASTILAFILSGEKHPMKLEERSRMITFLGKYISTEQLSAEEVERIASTAISEANKGHLKNYLTTAACKSLKMAQRLAIYINAYDAAFIDGEITLRETSMLSEIRQAFQLTPKSIKTINAVLDLKNDSGVLTNELHPSNEPGFDLWLEVVKD